MAQQPDTACDGAWITPASKIDAVCNKCKITISAIDANKTKNKCPQCKSNMRIIYPGLRPPMLAFDCMVYSKSAGYTFHRSCFLNGKNGTDNLATPRSKTSYRTKTY
jgi:hypothetical protein